MQKCAQAALIGLLLQWLLPACGPRSQNARYAQDERAAQAPTAGPVDAGAQEARPALGVPGEAPTKVGQACRTVQERGSALDDGAGSDSGASSGAFLEGVRQARARLAPLRSESWVERRQNAADVLFALAEALAEAPLPTQQLVSATCSVEAEAIELTEETANPFEAAARIKQALSSALAGITAQVAGQEATRALKPWLEAARRAVAALDERTTVAFQGAAIQDAFRTVSDALLALARRAAQP